MPQGASWRRSSHRVDDDRRFLSLELVNGFRRELRAPRSAIATTCALYGATIKMSASEIGVLSPVALGPGGIP